ncbi:MAG: hypothetical protein R3D85_04960 [Paracoccaceae bacterium]
MRAGWAAARQLQRWMSMRGQASDSLHQRVVALRVIFLHLIAARSNM